MLSKCTLQALQASSFVFCRSNPLVMGWTTPIFELDLHFDLDYTPVKFVTCMVVTLLWWQNLSMDRQTNKYLPNYSKPPHWWFSLQGYLQEHFYHNDICRHTCVQVNLSFLRSNQFRLALVPLAIVPHAQYIVNRLHYSCDVQLWPFSNLTISHQSSSLRWPQWVRDNAWSQRVVFSGGNLSQPLKFKGYIKIHVVKLVIQTWLKNTNIQSIPFLEQAL